MIRKYKAKTSKNSMPHISNEGISVYTISHISKKLVTGINVIRGGEIGQDF